MFAVIPNTSGVTSECSKCVGDTGSCSSRFRASVLILVFLLHCKLHFDPEVRSYATAWHLPSSHPSHPSSHPYPDTSLLLRRR